MSGRPSYKEAQERLMKWCQNVTKDYENVKITNFTSSFADGLAFCAIIHHYYPESFDYQTLRRDERKINFDLAFRIAEEQAQIHPLLETEDMLKMGNEPDKKCVFTYLLTMHNHLKHRER